MSSEVAASSLIFSLWYSTTNVSVTRFELQLLQLLSPYSYSCVLILFCPHGKSCGFFVTCWILLQDETCCSLTSSSVVQYNTITVSPFSNCCFAVRGREINIRPGVPSEVTLSPAVLKNLFLEVEIGKNDRIHQLKFVQILQHAPLKPFAIFGRRTFLDLYR